MNKSGRVVGMAVFALGVIILLFILGVAYDMFASPASDLLPSGGGDTSPLTAIELGRAVAWVLVKTVLLFVMTLAGALIASRGIQLYLGSGERISPEKTN